jgi:two-component system sensor histidine kinase KdpD
MRSRALIREQESVCESATDSCPEGKAGGCSNFHQYQAVAAMVLGISLPSMFLRPVMGSPSIALIYLLGVVVASLFVGRGPSLLAAVMSALFWDFCFLEPLARLKINNVEDAAMFGTYFTMALVLGQLTAGFRAQQRRQRLRERRSSTLYQLTRKLAEDSNLEQMLRNVVQQTEAAFAAQIALLLTNSAGQLSYHVHPASTYDITGPEQRVADWVFENGLEAGQFTRHFDHVDTLFVPLTANGRALGVIGLNFKDPSAPNNEQRSLLKAFCEHIGRALGRLGIGPESERAPCWLDSSASVRPCST